MTEPMRWRMFGYMAALFVAGAITGAAVMSHLVTSKQSLKVGRSGEIEGLIRQKLMIELELTPEQRQKFDPIFKKTADEMEASHVDCLKRICTALDNMHAEIRPTLTPAQLDKLKQIEAERRVMMRKKYNYPPDGTNACIQW
ncbi:MAG TPA: hypothetical protein VFB72_00580 [Verrucomicrobiae bacterium]|nr:hypothetical protein [Verrucomicrobiae bacterium]